MNDETMSANGGEQSELLNDFANMRNTMAKFIQLIKQQDERIKVLEMKLADTPLKTPEQILLDRYTSSSLKNRNLNADPKVVAFAAHLYHIKQIPAVRISSYGLLSQSKMHGLSTWDNQHLMDFCALNGVTDIYQNGVSDTVAKGLMTNWAGMKDYLDSRTDDDPKPTKPTKLGKALKKVNEQHAQPIDLMAD